jgi:hypothetical protein
VSHNVITLPEPKYPSRTFFRFFRRPKSLEDYKIHEIF